MQSLKTSINAIIFRYEDRNKTIVLDGCLDCTIKNIGANNVLLNNSIILEPNEVLEFSCNEGEILSGKIEINYRGNASQLQVIQRIFEPVQ